MVKVARLINGQVICGYIINQPGREQWSHLFFVQLAPQDDGKMGMKFIPAVQFGDFSQSIVIEDGIVYSYAADPEFIISYRHAIAQYQAALDAARQKNQNNIVAPTTAEIIDITKK